MTTMTKPVDFIRSAFESFNARNFDAVLANMTDDFVINIAGSPEPQYGKEAWQANIDMVLGAFPDLRAEVEDCFSDGDKVAVRVTFHGTHTGDFLGVPATGRKVSYQSNELYLVADGKFAEEWIVSDLASLMRQISDNPA